MKNSKQLLQTAATRNSSAHPTLPPTGLLRLHHVLAVFPVSKSTWWAGVKSGRYPPSVKLSPRTTAWPATTIIELIEKHSHTERANECAQPQAKTQPQPNAMGRS